MNKKAKAEAKRERRNDRKLNPVDYQALGEDESNLDENEMDEETDSDAAAVASESPSLRSINDRVPN